MEHSCEAGEEIWMCEKELGEEDKEKIGEVMVSSGSFCNSTEPSSHENCYTFVCSAACYRCDIKPSAPVMRNICITLL